MDPPEPSPTNPSKLRGKTAKAKSEQAQSPQARSVLLPGQQHHAGREGPVERVLVVVPGVVPAPDRLPPHVAADVVKVSVVQVAGGVGIGDAIVDGAHGRAAAPQVQAQQGRAEGVVVDAGCHRILTKRPFLRE